MSAMSKLTSGVQVGVIGILCAVLSSALLGGAALYQAERSHQARVMSERLQTLERSLSVKLSGQTSHPSSDQSSSQLNYDKLDPERYPSTRAKYLRPVPARVDGAHGSTPDSISDLDSQESARAGIAPALGLPPTREPTAMVVVVGAATARGALRFGPLGARAACIVRARVRRARPFLRP